MKKLSTDNLMKPKEYVVERAVFRRMVVEHKKDRCVALGPNATLYFEDFLTMKYQAQEIMRVERIVSDDAIQEEADAYNALIPDGDNWKATFMLEYPDADVRRVELAKLVGVEHQVFVEVETCDRCIAIADEDLPRSTDEKTSSVHFLRFPLSQSMIDAIKQGAEVRVGVQHEHLSHRVRLSEKTLARIKQDLTG